VRESAHRVATLQVRQHLVAYLNAFVHQFLQLFLCEVVRGRKAVLDDDFRPWHVHVVRPFAAFLVERPPRLVLGLRLVRMEPTRVLEVLAYCPVPERRSVYMPLPHGLDDDTVGVFVLLVLFLFHSFSSPFLARTTEGHMP